MGGRCRVIAVDAAEVMAEKGAKRTRPAAMRASRKMGARWSGESTRSVRRGWRTRERSCWNATCTAGSFLLRVVRALAGFGDHDADVLIGEFAEALVAVVGLLDGGEFLGSDVAGAVRAVAPGLEAARGGRVLGAIAVLVLAELAQLHGRDGLRRHAPRQARRPSRSPCAPPPGPGRTRRA